MCSSDLLPRYESTSYYSLVAPAATPRPVLATLNAAMQKILALPDIRDSFGKAGFDPSWQNLDEAAAWLRTQTAKWAAVVKAAGIEPD